MKAVYVAVLAIFAICAMAQENPECDSIRAKIKAVRDTAQPGDLKAVETKVNEYKGRLDSLGCQKETKPVVTRETEDPECASIRAKLRALRATTKKGDEPTEKKADEYKRRLDALKCSKRSAPLPDRTNENPECESMRVKIRALRATTGDADKKAVETKVNEYKTRMDSLKCVNRLRDSKENAECATLRSKIRSIRATAQPGQRAEVEKKVNEYKVRMDSINCERPKTDPVNRDNEPAECSTLRSKIRVTRLTIKNKADQETKVAEYKRRLDALRCAKRAETPVDRKNENPECENLRTKIRSLRATTSPADKAAVETKVAEYKVRLDALKCVAVRPTPVSTGKCFVSGCNREVCSEQKNTMSPCWFKPEYKCLKYAQCGNYGAGGKCDWKKSTEYNNCRNDQKVFL